MVSKSMRFVLAALLLAPAPAMALQTQTNPIPGIDVVVKKQPTGSRISVAITDARGNFTVRISESGEYQISSDCRNPRAPRPCPARTLSVRGTGTELRRNRDGSYDFAVRRGRPVVLTGTVLTATTAATP